MSLRWKIVGGFGLLLALIGLLGWVTLSLFSSLRTVQRRVFDDAVPGLVTVDEITRSYTAQSAAVRGFLIQSQDSLLEQYRVEVGAVRVAQRDGRRLFTSTAERALLERLIRAGTDYQRLVETRVIPLADEGRRASAIALLGRQGTSLMSQIEELGNDLRELQREVVIRSESDLASRSSQARVILLVVIIGALIAGTVLTVVLPRRLSSNIQTLVGAARAVGGGDFDQRIDIRSGDEIEELGARFGEMQSGLKRLQQLALQDHELEIASSIQRNLLQRTMPPAPGVLVVPVQRQANLVGGDWYDVDLSSSAVTVAVGDSSGKGIGAALMATVVLSVLRAERALGAGPKRVIERANKALQEAAEPDSFTTLVYATIDFNSGTASWLNMGHPPPFLLTRRECDEAPQDGGPRGYFLEGPRNRALGWFDDPGLAETVVELRPGDRLVLYTDGFLEARSPDGAMFGEHRLAQAMAWLSALESGALGDALVGEIERFTAGKLDDDLTVLVIEYQGAPEGGPGAHPIGESSWRSRR
jgi:serine phosphatase RsbU (regulator of sigma subunit)/CHASE3 domain sensor protein